MNITQKTIIDDVQNILTRFSITDESRLNDVWIGWKINQIRADLITKQYKDTEIIDQSWLSDLGLVSFHEVNISDDASFNYCDCPISKAFIPQLITLPTKIINQDLGIQMIMSACAKRTRYANRSMSQWNFIPTEHTYSLFPFYYRINTAIYVNRKVDKLRIVALLQDPSDGFYVNSLTIPSGSIVSGTVYLVKDAQIIYDSVVYSDGDTFTGTATTTYGGSGLVYLNSQKEAYIETKPYPVSAEMARYITLEICTKEFGIERSQVVDLRNDAKDSQKSQG
jgi:hypothetical protein